MNTPNPADHPSPAPQTPPAPGGGLPAAPNPSNGGWPGEAPAGGAWIPAGAPAPAWTQQTDWARASAPLPRPGIPFRPLGLGELFSGAFELIRFAAAPLLLIPLVPMLILGVLNGISAYRSFASLEYFGMRAQGATADEALSLFWSSFFPLISGSLLMTLLASLVNVLMMAALYITASEAIIGRRIVAGEALSRSAPRIMPMLGTWILSSLALGGIIAVSFVLGIAPMIGLFGASAQGDSPAGEHIALAFAFLLACVTAGFLFVIVVQTRLLYGYAACALEGLGPLSALKRSWALTRGAFARTFGRFLLASLALGALTSILSSASSALLFALPTLAIGLGSALTTIVVGLSLPFLVCFLSLMYTDERFRKEGFGPVLEQARASRIG